MAKNSNILALREKDNSICNSSKKRNL